MWKIGIVLECIFMIYFLTFKLRADGKYVFWKTLTSLGFFTLSLFAYSATIEPMYYWLIIIGLGLGVAGDYFLAMQYHQPKKKQLFFILGLGAFAMGHIAYSAAFYDANSLHPIWIIIVSVILAGITVAMLIKLNLQFQNMLPAVLFYCTVIYFMEIQALCLLSQPNMALIVVNIGTLLFVISDLILSFVYFHDMDTVKMNRLNLVFYYIAQILIAMHLYLL